MRTICTDKHLEVADEEMGGNSYSDDGILAEMTEASMGMIAQGARLGVIVDRMEHLQSIMDLMSLFIPYTASSKLTVTGTYHLSNVATLLNVSEYCYIDTCCTFTSQR